MSGEDVMPTSAHAEVREFRRELREDLAALRVELRAFASSVDGAYVRTRDLDTAATSWSHALTSHELRIDEQLRALAANVARIDSWLTWAQRTVLGVVILAVLSLVIIGGTSA